VQPNTRMLSWRLGEWWTVFLACGHKRRHIRKGDLKRGQLFIGKRVPCADCVRGRKREL
jgi:hypothetical protein